MYARGEKLASSRTSKSNGSPAYLRAVPRSVSMSAMRGPRPVAIASELYVLPAPLGPTSARRAFAADFDARTNPVAPAASVIREPVRPRRSATRQMRCELTRRSVSSRICRGRVDEVLDLPARGEQLRRGAIERELFLHRQR